MKSWVITSKDLRLLFRDRRALTVLVLLPLIFITIIGLTTGRLLGWQRSNQILIIAAVDLVDYESYSEDEMERTLARNLVTKIFNGLQEEEGIEIQEVETEEQAKHLTDMEEATAYLVIRPDFVENVFMLRPGDIMHPDTGKLKGDLESIGVFLSSREPGSSTAVIIRNVVFAEVWKKISPIVTCENNFLRRNASVGISEMCDELYAEAEQPPIERRPPDAADTLPTDTIYQELVPSYTVLFVFFLVNIMGRSFIHERELGTLRRLRMSPIGKPSLLTGKTVPFLVISLVQTALLFVCGKLLFDMSWGATPWLLLPVAFFTSTAATALGLLVATMVRTESQVSAYGNTVVITMAGISGCFMPRKWLPDAMQTLSLATPHAWALQAYDQILNRAAPNLPLIAQACGWLAAFTLLYFALGTWRFARAS